MTSKWITFYPGLPVGQICKRQILSLFWLPNSVRFEFSNTVSVNSYIDFVVIAGNVEVEVNGLCINDNKKKPLTLFQCQLKLFKDWVPIWNPQQQEYLLLRLKDLDANFYTKYEEFLEHGENKPKDFFEPGVPAELVRASRKSSSTSSSPNVSLNGKESESEGNETEPEKDLEDHQPLSTIQEDE